MLTDVTGRFKYAVFNCGYCAVSLIEIEKHGRNVHAINQAIK